MVDTSDYPLWAVGTYEQGLEHLRKATEGCPDFGENHLTYAKALLEDGREQEARKALQKVIACPTPPDYSAEHKAWLEEATELLTDLQPET
jgi:hypothetical protein